jgi:hypothetical protein
VRLRVEPHRRRETSRSTPVGSLGVREEQHSELRRSRLEQPHVAEGVRVGIRGEQSAALSVDADHRLVDRDLSRVDVAVWLEIGLFAPGRDSRFGFTRQPTSRDLVTFERDKPARWSRTPA